MIVLWIIGTAALVYALVVLILNWRHQGIDWQETPGDFGLSWNWDGPPSRIDGATIEYTREPRA